MSNLRNTIVDMLDDLSTKQLKDLKMIIENIGNANLENAEPEEVKVKKIRKNKNNQAKSMVELDMTKSEMKEAVRKLQVNVKDAGPDLAKFLKKVYKFAEDTSVSQLKKMAKEKEIEFVFGRGRQTPQGKKQKMAAQVLVA